MTYAWREEIAATETSAWGCSWGITAPWAHPFWQQYALHLYDLTTLMGRPPILHLPAATHEFVLDAIHPDTKLMHDVPLSSQRYTPLHPSNCGYQFRAKSNDAARDRVQSVVNEIVAERLSPDTDYRSRWDVIFSDGFPLVKSGLTELAHKLGYGRGTVQ